MNTIAFHRAEIEENGFTIIENVYSNKEVAAILALIENTATDKATFRKSEDLFAIRQFLKEVPTALLPIFNKTLVNYIQDFFGSNYFVVKSIYFDKPETSNWYVAYHQDLTISVDKKMNIDGYGPWTTKPNQFAVQPHVSVLENIFTIRIHLDDTTQENGALKVIPKSHAKKIYRPETIDWTVEKETICKVPKGGVMFMKPLLLHSSGRTTKPQRRRVIHIEFSNVALPSSLQWAERLSIPSL